MPRPRLRRELCDCRDCVDGLAFPLLAEQKHAAALLDPPPKCVVLYGDSFLALSTDCADDAVSHDIEPRSAAQGQPADSLDAARCPHLDRVAQDGCSGFVAMRASEGTRVQMSSWLQTSPPRVLLPWSSTASASCLRHAGVPKHGVEALQQLFGGQGGTPQNPATIADRWSHIRSHLACHRGCDAPDKWRPIALLIMLTRPACRFKQLHAVLVSNDDAAAAAGPGMGFLRGMQLDAACGGPLTTRKQQEPAVSLPSAESVAAFVATTLGAPCSLSVACTSTAHQLSIPSTSTSTCRVSDAAKHARCSRWGQQIHGG